MQAVIMAGGKGTRIREVSSTVPKPMIEIAGKPILLYEIENLRECGIKDIILVVGYLKESIIEYFGDGSKWGVNISYFSEETPLGTAGALFYLGDRLEDDFILLMGDLIISVDFNRFMRAHKEWGALVTLFTHPNSHPYDSDLIIRDRVGSIEDFTIDKCNEDVPVSVSKVDKAKARVVQVSSKNDKRNEYYHNEVNAGIYIINKEALICTDSPGAKVDLDKDIIAPLIAKGRVYAYRSTEYCKDMGTKERYTEVENALSEGLPKKRNLSNKQACIFLDRDGTINKNMGFVDVLAKLTLIEGAGEAIARINASEYLCIVITNQPVIARGECSLTELDNIHKKLESLLGEKGAYLDDIYFCPHHPDKGFKGEIESLKFNCNCRKPATGMIKRASLDHNIDLSRSYFIGDSMRDLKCALNSGMRSFKVPGENDEGGEELPEGSFRVKNIAEALNIIGI